MSAYKDNAAVLECLMGFVLGLDSFISELKQTLESVPYSGKVCRVISPEFLIEWRHTVAISQEASTLGPIELYQTTAYPTNLLRNT